MKRKQGHMELETVTPGGRTEWDGWGPGGGDIWWLGLLASPSFCFVVVGLKVLTLLKITN